MGGSDPPKPKLGESDAPNTKVCYGSCAMRVEPHSIGSYVHTLKRGARGMPITQDERDRDRFPQLLCYMNDQFKDDFWERNTAKLELFARPETWPEKRPLVKILA